jgi:hypothetical protein
MGYEAQAEFDDDEQDVERDADREGAIERQRPVIMAAMPMPVFVLMAVSMFVVMTVLMVMIMIVRRIVAMVVLAVHAGPA